MEHTKHIFRAVILLILIVIGFIVFRQIAIPKSFGEHGFYRADNVKEQMAKPVVHGSIESCLSCKREADAGKKLAAGAHAKVYCETCHAPLSTHVKDGKKIAPMAVDKSYMLCVRCHEKLAARPGSFPQVNVKEHLAGFDVEMSENVCMDCHEAHDPSPE